ncbi:hypothetical protein [Deinococcus radiophilus]|uniref:hypothetical protein n=1 Tax=Deinococcus radiophilus TaxID=32062 RepID=UPI001E620CCF|nr:hypothetical protein [Deinococcus radiophilus]UFA51490.1 hypothetical protein LMT64_11785 [Deinococcus radiophilus]
MKNQMAQSSALKPREALKGGYFVSEEQTYAITRLRLSSEVKGENLSEILHMAQRRPLQNVSYVTFSSSLELSELFYPFAALLNSRALPLPCPYGKVQL